MKSYRIPFRVVFYREDDRWVAHCLEFNLIGDGESHDEALEALAEAIRIQLEATVAFQNPRNLFTPADGDCFQKFAAGKDVAIGELHLELDSIVVDAESAREYSDDLVTA